MTVKHTIAWVDIPVIYLDRALAFYSEISGELVQKTDEHGFAFGLLPHQEDNVSGCLCVIPGRKPSRDGVLVYLNVEGRLAAAVEAARALGQEILMEKEQVGPYGHRAVILDTEGNAIALYSKEA